MSFLDALRNREAAGARSPRTWGPANHEWVAIDVETATRSRDSLCAIAAVRVDAQGQLGDRFSRLVQPPGNTYEIWNTRVHGLSADNTRTAPSAAEVLPDLVEFVASRPVIAHNSDFDRGVIASTFASASIDAWEWHCTLEFARLRWPELRNHKLPTVCTAAGVRLVDHHDATADAAACAELAAVLIAGSPDRTLDSLRSEMQAVWVAPRNDEFVLRRRTPKAEALEWTEDDLCTAQLVVDAWLRGDKLREIDESSALGPGKSAQLINRLRKNGLAIPSRGRGRGLTWLQPVPHHLEVRFDHLGPRRRTAKDTPEATIAVVFTGEVPSSSGRPDRSSLETMAREVGWVVRTGVSKRTDFVIHCDPAFHGGKFARARELGTPIVSIDRFLYEVRAHQAEEILLR